MSESTLLAMKELVSEQNNKFQESLKRAEEIVKAAGETKSLQGELAKLKEAVNAIEEKNGRLPATTVQLGKLSDKVRNHQEFKSMLSRPDRRGMLNMVLPGSLFETKAILTSIAGSSITQIPGVAQQPTAQGLRGLIPVRQVSTGTVQFLQQQTRSGTPAGVQAHEGDVKAELALTVTLKSAPVATVAGWTRASKQILDDLDSFLNFLDVELTSSVLEAETDLILTGNHTTAGEFDGLLTVVPSYTDTGSATGDTALDVLIRARTALGAANVIPTGLVLAPEDAGAIAGLKNENLDYLNPATSPAFTNLSVVVTSVMTAGTFLLGDFRTGAEIEEREAVNVMVSSEDADNFTKNLLTVRAEERVSLSIFKPWAFLHGSLTPAAPGLLEARNENLAGNGGKAHAPAVKKETVRA